MDSYAISETEVLEIDGGKVTLNQMIKILCNVAKFTVTHPVRPIAL